MAIGGKNTQRLTDEISNPVLRNNFVICAFEKGLPWPKGVLSSLTHRLARLATNSNNEPALVKTRCASASAASAS